MKKQLLFITCLFFSVSSTAILSGCVPAAVVGVMGGTTAVATSASEERGLGGVISDSELKSRISNRIEEINADAARMVDIVVRQGRVLLSGTVENQKMQIDAVRAAWEIPGTREVMDDIHVGAEPDMGQAARDSLVTTQLKTTLWFTDDIASINYNVHTNNGIVYLMGIAQNQAELDHVLKIARNIGGVKEVISYVTLKEQPFQYTNSDPFASPDEEPVSSTSPTPRHNPYFAPETIQQPNNSSAFQ